jgi:LuxR family transcriptional regulator, maltose regulon positive regulatory protein
VHEPPRGTATTIVVRLERTQLLARLDAGAALPLVVAHAGAGFGKTTLAAQWAEHDHRPHATVRVGRFMDEPAALALHLVDALESLGADASTSRALVSGSEPRFSALALPALTRLASAPPRPFVLAVDDAHLLSNPDCHVVLEAVSEGLAPGSQLALLTRLGVPAWAARARAEGRLLELGPLDLAFSDEESRRLLTQLGVVLRQDQVTDVVQRSEGWPIGLYLMALAAGRDSRLSVPVAPPSGSDRYVLDYIRGEVLTGLPRRSRDFLRRTAILHELDVRLCDAVVQRQDSGRILADLARRLQLVLATDATGRRYRYHHLLVDAMRVDLAEQEPWLEGRLHQRASAWYEAEGDGDRAIQHARAADDLERVSRLVWAGTPACIASGHPDRLRAWLDGLHESQVRSDRWLTLSAAWLALQTGDPNRMTRWMLAADEHAGPDWTRQVASDAYAASLAALHVVVGDLGLDSTVELCRGIQRALPSDSGFRASAFHNEGVALTLTRRRAEGLASLQEAERLARALRVPVIEANALAWQGLIALMDDDWARGAPLITRSGELVRAHRLDRLATSVISLTAMALLQAARGTKKEARVTLGTARRLTVEVRSIAPWFAVAGPLVQARVAMLLGDGALARALCAEATGHMVPDLEDTVLADFLVDTEHLLRRLRSTGFSESALTPAELRILQFLPSRLTLVQIGEHVFLSKNTVKTHALAIYRKLGVSSRDEAVARARSLGLVESPPAD